MSVGARSGGAIVVSTVVFSLSNGNNGAITGRIDDIYSVEHYVVWIESHRNMLFTQPPL